ncbi:2',3'-cyclic-nucleotide 3'-phosphodiesterase [Fulvia fulva]|uniref:2',3'-cyclic-nucleotide 3'-phosphodiesterase n=1 Tax=Passalora fulva TaxID=5499 RepID=A0A9Q8LBV6_PASFU|nr:2',3'-cyclic-nucleotide 3'-phosphodiesterase [Fulvia fulva]KAK4631918.1 2',3'-cyclic-nucleotide 3'-phosphodiesterase [Fulvia fulva]KAK4632614.1 2',3'-cyclic-nucleotide 3'-phosphodiesterase [Fulvia fulva]UJO14615.1 2',3'-cyclic-nucleotide 3'-phosphodiesterase [Fulvia fulva]WPV11694.1 2',3'-cyclic-nucleotide 3'-phosphodiesterase [Fulvia fulva]WPV26690.1 2',3'-cyclic-nucleotide 3'-phosphodiesterase [Fulvia fulva]
MGGLSLWLIPHDDKPFVKTMQELISETIPRQFDAKTHSFQPHVTVTSDISEDAMKGKSPQEWLDSLLLDELKLKNEHNEVLLELDTIEAEDPFFRKMNIALKDNENLRKLVALCRRESGLDEAFAQKEYRPHFSLLYSDIPTKDVKAKVPLIEMKIGFALGDLFACCGGALCLGGSMVLVDTRKEIEEWSVMATRVTPWAMWRATRGLL